MVTVKLNTPKFSVGDKVQLIKDVKWTQPDYTSHYIADDGFPHYRKHITITFQRKGDVGIIKSLIVVPIGRGLVYYTIDGFVDPAPFTGYVEEELKLVK